MCGPAGADDSQSFAAPFPVSNALQDASCAGRGHGRGCGMHYKLSNTLQDARLGLMTHRGIRTDAQQQHLVYLTVL